MGWFHGRHSVYWTGGSEVTLSQERLGDEEVARKMARKRSRDTLDGKSGTRLGVLFCAPRSQSHCNGEHTLQ